MYKETLNAVLAMLTDVTVPVYASHPDPRVRHPGDTRLLPGVEPTDPRATRIVIHKIGDSFDVVRSANAQLDYDLGETETHVQTIPYPQPRKLRYQIEFKGTLEAKVDGLKQDFLRKFEGGESIDTSITWTVAGQVVSFDNCAVTIDGMRDMTSTYNNQRRIRHIITIEVDTWLWTDQEPTSVPKIAERILRRGMEIGGDDTRYITHLEE